MAPSEVMKKAVENAGIGAIKTGLHKMFQTGAFDNASCVYNSDHR